LVRVGIVLAVILLGWFTGTKRDAVDTAPDRASGHAPGSPSLPIRDTLAIIFRTPVVLLLMLAFLGANFVAFIFLTWTPTFLKENLVSPLGSAGLAELFIYTWAALGGWPMAGFWLNRLVRRFLRARMQCKPLADHRGHFRISGRQNNQRCHVAGVHDLVRIVQRVLWTQAFRLRL